MTGGPVWERGDRCRLGRPRSPSATGTGRDVEIREAAGLDTPRPSLEELFVGLTGEGFDVDG